MKHKQKLLCALTGSLLSSGVFAQTSGSDEEMVVVGLRENRTSKGATGLALELKDTPQSISILDQSAMQDFNVTGSNDALELTTGVNVEQYETNRASFNSRGFDIQLTQIDGLGMTNDFGTVVGQQDTYLFEKIELIRGANGLLTGVGNASGTINFVRKRPTNEDQGEVIVSGGSYGFKRLAADYNKVLTSDGSWAGRVVMSYEDKDSHLRDLHDENSTFYGVIDGQIGQNGVLTAGVTLQKSDQDSPMWGSLTLYYPDGSLAEFDHSTSTSQDWTYYNGESQNAFIEYKHLLSQNWEAKITYNVRSGETDSRLLYAYNPLNQLNDDDTGLIGWPYSAHTETDNELLDFNISGSFAAFGQEHSVIAGLSNSQQELEGWTYAFDEDLYLYLPLPALPFDGDSYPEPEWYPLAPDRSGEQELTRFYAATRLSLTESLKAIVGVNSIKLAREGSSRYGNAVNMTEYPDTEETSPYFGLTFDLTENMLAYVSYSDIFQNQDQTDFDGAYLDPMKGVNKEAGIKAEWLEQRLLTTAAIFSAEQKGLATYAGVTGGGTYFYEPKDVESKGIELEASGKISDNTNISIGFTRLELTGPDGNDIYEWVPRTTANLRFDTRVSAIPALRLGLHGRYESDVIGSYAKQEAHYRFNGFATYELTEAATLQLNVNNLFDEKYVEGISAGAIYSAPRHAQVSVSYKF